MNKCPVCEMQLPEPVPAFCTQCGWDLKNDLTFGIFLDLPDAVIEEYRQRVGIARQNWNAKTELLRKQAELEEKLRQMEAEMNRKKESEDVRLRQMEAEITQRMESENVQRRRQAELEERRRLEQPVRRFGDGNWIAAVLCLVLTGIGVWYFMRPNPKIPPVISIGSEPCGPKGFTNTIGQEFVCIEPGTFTMGSPENEPGRDSDETQHKVTLTKGFYMQTTEVTQGQWKAVMGNNPSDFKDCGDNCPVEEVSWGDAQEFIKKLNRKESTDRYRLPTEAEWEYAARAGTQTAYHWGNQADCSKANYGNGWSDECKGKNPGKTAAAKSYPANPWGLYDMSGNVWEWCADRYGAYPASSVTDPAGPSSGSARVLRGGCWGDGAVRCRSASRNGDFPGSRFSFLGFRVLAVPAAGLR